MTLFPTGMILNWTQCLALSLYSLPSITATVPASAALPFFMLFCTRASLLLVRFQIKMLSATVYFSSPSPSLSVTG